MGVHLGEAMPGPATLQFQEVIGRGGFGTVYRAVLATVGGFRKEVAVKVLHEHWAHDPSMAPRIRDEARVLGLLRHRALPSVDGLYWVDGRPALVTEYVEGATLTELYQGGDRLPPGVALEVCAEVASALHAALSREGPDGRPLRLVHRDVKPSNIQITRAGEVKLLDFGIARSEQLAREARTATGNMTFTPGYTAPEAFLTLTQGPPSDVFGLGATIYRALVAERFFEGLRLPKQAALCASREKFEAFVHERLERVEEVHSDLRPLLAACLRWDPGERALAADVSRRAMRIADTLSGPTLRKWARSATLPSEREVKGAPLTGRTVAEDDPTTVVTFVSWPPPPPVPAGLVPVAPEVRQDLTVDRPRVPMRPAPQPRSLAPALVVVAGVGLGMVVAVLLLVVASGLASWLMM